MDYNSVPSSDTGFSGCCVLYGLTINGGVVTVNLLFVKPQDLLGGRYR